MTGAAAAAPSFPSTELRRHPLAFPGRCQPAEDLESSWILEFVLRQPIPDSLAHEIFLSLPFSSTDLHPHLRKILLLRRVSSELRRRSISDRTLHSLELIEELDRLRGTRPSNRMKAAYCAAAVECTVAAHRSGAGDFKAIVEGFWMGSLFNLIRSEASAGLVSEPLLEWGKRMKHCLSSGDEIEQVLKTDVEDAIKLVKEYVDEALEDMGPSFLEIAAAEFVQKNATELNGSFGKLDEELKEPENDGVGEKPGKLSGDVRAPSEGLTDNCGKDLEEDRAREESLPLDDACIKLGNHRDNVVGPCQEMQVEENRNCSSVSCHDKPDNSEGLIQKVDPSEVTKVKEALKKSCFDLNMVVEDPLPEAHVVAAAVLASMSRASTSVDYKECSLEDVRCNVSGNSSDFKHLEENHVGKECNKDHGSSKSIGIVPCGSLFNRKPTAHTYEWSVDSIDSSSEKSQVPADNHQSSHPRMRRVFQPRLDKEKNVRRRAVKRWTSTEEDTLREAVAKYGKGNWKLIRNSYKIFEERTEVNLKDKWRNMSRH